MARILPRLVAFALCTSALVACDAGTGTPVGPEGGVVVSDDGRLTLEIPPGALDQVVDVSIHAVDAGPQDHVASYAIEPLGTPLVRPAHVEFDWMAEGKTDALSIEGSGMADPALIIERGPSWQALADRSLDVEAGYVSGSAHYFGTIAIVD